MNPCGTQENLSNLPPFLKSVAELRQGLIAEVCSPPTAPCCHHLPTLSQVQGCFKVTHVQREGVLQQAVGLVVSD